MVLKLKGLAESVFQIIVGGIVRLRWAKKTQKKYKKSEF